jgi:uncharacterized protein YcbX
MMRLTGLFIYPVKSLRGIAVDSAPVDELGLVGDRRFLVIDETGRFLTQRALPRMALVATALSADLLTLSAEGAGEVAVPRSSPANLEPMRRSVSVWKSEGLLADDCGEEAAGWLSDFLKTKCRLVRIGEKFTRPILKPDVAGPGDRVSFADAFPFLVISEGSLADLNDRLAAHGEETLPMNRFRPNLVVGGCAAFAEDTWPRLRIGEILLRAGGSCARCIITTTDQATAERGREPLRTLAMYRRDAADPTDVNFGQNLIHETKRGMIRVGDAVELV